MARLPAKQRLPVSGTLLIIAAITVFGQIDRSIISPAPADTNTPISTSVRVIIVIDASASMCRNPSSGGEGCCVTGDSTGNCMMNDPDDIRIQAAQMFVDSLAARSPASQVGVVTFSQSANRYNPLSLSTAENIQRIKEWIYGASCVAAGYNEPRITLPRTDTALPAPAGLGKTAGIKATYLGLGLQAGLSIIDTNIPAIPPGMSRHIILLTDGAWDDMATRTPGSLIDQYTANFPDRAVPRINGIFISNAALHISHGYPPEGCSSTDPIILNPLESVTQITRGRFFPASTPQTIIGNFKTLLDSLNLPEKTFTTKPFLIPGIASEHRRPGRAETHFNLLGKKVTAGRRIQPSPDKMTNGIYLEKAGAKTNRRKNMIVK